MRVVFFLGLLVVLGIGSFVVLLGAAVGLFILARVTIIIFAIIGFFAVLGLVAWLLLRRTRARTG